MKFALYTVVTVFAFIVMPEIGLAQQQTPLVPANCAANVTACNFCTMLEMGRNIVNLLFQLMVIVAVILIVIAGLKLATSAGNTQALENAKSMVTNVIIGLVIVLSAWFLVDTIFKMLVRGEFQTWNELSGVNCGGIGNPQQ